MTAVSAVGSRRTAGTTAVSAPRRVVSSTAPVTAIRQSAVARPPLPLRRPGTLPVLPLTLRRDGRLASSAQLEPIVAAARTATDFFLFCHGWLYDEAEARANAARFFTLLEPVLASLGERIVPLGVAVHWPSKPFADADLGRTDAVEGVWPALQHQVVSRAATGAERLLVELCRAEVPASPEEEAELDVLLSRVLGRGTRGGMVPSLFQALSFWTMKRRAGEVVERLGRETLVPLWRDLGHAPRLHLIGHSFGAKLVTSAVLGGARPESLTLLLGAFSAFAFTPQVPGFKRPGLYHRVVAERQVQGPIVVLRSDHDTALGTFYRAATTHGEVGRDPARTAGGLRRTDSVVATSALGAVGARGVGAPKLDLVDVQQTGIATYPIVNIDGSAVVRAREPLVGAHRDIYHYEIAALIAMAAGLVVGGPTGARAKPLDPLSRP